MARRQGRSVPWINTLMVSDAVRTDEWRWYDDVWNNYLVSIGVCICLWNLFLEVSLPIFVWWYCRGVFHLVVHGVWNGVWSNVSLVCIGCLVRVLVCAYHREITPTAISGPRFHAPLHIFPPPPGPAGGPSRTWRGESARWRHLM